MTQERARANGEGLPETPTVDPNGHYCTRDEPETAVDKILQIRGLARVGAAATDYMMGIDLSESGYLSLFEIIHEICNELTGQVERLEIAARQTKREARPVPW